MACVKYSMAENELRTTISFNLALITLYTHGSLSNKDLAEKMQINEHQVSSILRDLKRCGYVVTKNGQYDDRKKINSLTEKGLLHAGHAFAGQQIGRALAKKEGFHLLPDDEDERQFFELVKDFNKKVSELFKKKGKKKVKA